MGSLSGGLYVVTASQVEGEKIRFIDIGDLWPYIIVTAVSAIIISPCQFLSLKDCDNPGKSKAIVNMNSVIAFLLAIYFIRGTKIEMKTLIGISMAAFGVYLIM